MISTSEIVERAIEHGAGIRAKDMNVSALYCRRCKRRRGVEVEIDRGVYECRVCGSIDLTPFSRVAQRALKAMIDIVWRDRPWWWGLNIPRSHKKRARSATWRRIRA